MSKDRQEIPRNHLKLVDRGYNETSEHNSAFFSFLFGGSRVDE